MIHCSHRGMSHPMTYFCLRDFPLKETINGLFIDIFMFIIIFLFTMSLNIYVF